MEMLHDATQYLERVRQTLIDADRFEGILQVRSAGELYRQYASQRRYGLGLQNIGFLGHAQFDTTQIYAASTSAMIKESYQQALSR